MKDYILRTTAFNNSARAFFAVTTGLAEEARKTHGLRPTAAAALSRVLTASAILSCTLKNENDKMTIAIKGEGPLGSIVVSSNSSRNVKGYVHNPYCELPLKENGKLNVREAVGSGTLSIIRDMGLKEPYVGKINLVSGEIADDLTYYFAKSEQIPTSVALGEIIDTDCSVKAAGGFVIQLLPGTDAYVGDMIHEKLTTLPALSAMYADGARPEDIAELVLGDFGYEITEKYETKYLCDCSREKTERSLLSIGAEDLRNIYAEDKKAELVCHFCNKKYRFDEEDLKRLCKAAGIEL